MGPEILPKALRNPGKQRIKQLVKPSSLYIYNPIIYRETTRFYQLLYSLFSRVS